MKYFIAGLLLAASAAQAGTIATAENQVGGAIEITDATCSQNKNMRLAHNWGPETNDQYGCYVYDSTTNHVIVQWYDQAGYTHGKTYNLSDFTWTAYGKQRIADYNRTH